MTQLRNDTGLASQTFKQDSNLLRSNDPLMTQGLNQNQNFVQNQMGQNGAQIIERDIRIVESNLGTQGSPRLMQGSPNRQFIQGSPTGLYQGSPLKQTGLNQSLGQYSGYSTGTNSSSQSTQILQGQNLIQGQNFGTTNQNFTNQQQFVSGQTVVEKIYEAPIVVTHHEQAIVKSLYEGKEVLYSEEQTRTNQITNAPIIKQIHQDIIHEHHKDILVEHKKDIVHEHHQNVVIQHNQPIIYEKHIHEHHQPIIHEKHTTLIEEKHVPIITEQQTFTTNVQERQNVVTEVFEAPVVNEVFVNPIRTEVFAETIVQREGSQFSGSQFSSGNQQVRTVVEETYSTGNNLGTGFNQGTYLGENQVYNNEVDEFGRPKKAGFFSGLKQKLGGNKKNTYENKNY